CRMSSGAIERPFSLAALTALTCPSPKQALKNPLWRAIGRRPLLRQWPQSSPEVEMPMGTPKSQSTLQSSFQRVGSKVYGPIESSPQPVQPGDPWSKFGSRDRMFLGICAASAYITSPAG